MKTVLFLLATDDQIKYHQLNHYMNYSVMGVGDGSTGNDGTMYMLTSDIYTASEMKAKYGTFGTWKTASEAYNFGETNFVAYQTGDSFSMPITHDDLKKQCRQDIAELDENKAHSLMAKKDYETGGLSQAEEDFINSFLSSRDAILNQYETDKTTLGFA